MKWCLSWPTQLSSQLPYIRRVLSSHQIWRGAKLKQQQEGRLPKQYMHPLRFHRTWIRKVSSFSSLCVVSRSESASSEAVPVCNTSVDMHSDPICTTRITKDDLSHFSNVEDRKCNHDTFKASRQDKCKAEQVKVNFKLSTCSKLLDLHGALELYDTIKREGLVNLNVNSYNMLLYVCSGAALGSLAKSRSRSKEKKGNAPIPQILPDSSEESTSTEDSRVNETTEENLVHFGPEDMELAARRGAEIVEDMLDNGLQPNEATFTSIIRLGVAKNDGDFSFEALKLMASSGIAPKMRSYGPPLHCFSENNQLGKAFEVYDHMLEHGIFPDENMLDSLLKVSIACGDEGKVYALLQRLRDSVREVSPATVKTIERWFTCKASSAAGKANWEKMPSDEELRQATMSSGGGWHGLGWLGQGPWQVKRTHIGASGSCLNCGEGLCTVDLDPKETEEFAKCIAKLACQREKQPNAFEQFQNWLDRHGPFDVIIDGANVGLYNPQVSHGFSLMLLREVVKASTERFSTGRPPLVLLHRRHEVRLSTVLQNKGILRNWRAGASLYYTPPGSNDDWFWLYAAVKSHCLLVTNDEMRDHIFELLGNEFFPKWKERHQVRFTFSFTPKHLDLHMPPPYSIVIQESPRGSWHVPQAGGNDIDVPREWLCVTRENPGSLV